MDLDLLVEEIFKVVTCSGKTGYKYSKSKTKQLIEEYVYQKLSEQTQLSRIENDVVKMKEQVEKQDDVYVSDFDFSGVNSTINASNGKDAYKKGFTC